MRVLHVSDRLTDRGGAYQHLLAVIARQMRDADVHLAVGRSDPGVVAPCDTSVVPGLAERVRAPAAIDDVVMSFRPDAVHVHTVVNPDALERIGSLSSVTKVLTVHDHRYFCPGKGKWTEDGEPCTERMSSELCTKCFSDDAYYRDVLELTAARYEALRHFRVVVLSRYMRRELALPDGQVSVIPPFVHGLDRDAAPAEPACVLFVGRLVASKGVEDAVAAWRKADVGLPLVGAGTGSLRDSVTEMEVLGWVSRPELSALYRRAASVLMPSRWQEPFGIVGLEALTMGTPVVAWESGGVSEWHPGPLVAWGDVDGLARALRDAIGRPAAAPPGFEPDALMARLDAVYR